MDGKSACGLPLRAAVGIALVGAPCFLSACDAGQEEAELAAREGSQACEPEPSVSSNVGELAGQSLAELIEKGLQEKKANEESHSAAPVPSQVEEDAPATAESQPTGPEPSAQPADPPQEGIRISPSCSTLHELTNEYRVQAGVAALAFDSKLHLAAQARAEEMAAAGRSSHTRPDGSSCFSIFDQYGIAYDSAGENIADGFKSTRAACEALYASAEHRDNMLNPAFTKLGTGMAKSSNGVCYWVQLFSD